MNFSNYTIKAQEAVQKAAEIAAGLTHQSIDTQHILKGIMLSDENVFGFLTKKIGVNVGLLNSKLEESLQSLPKVSGQNQYLSNEAASALQKANNLLKEFKDEFVSIELIILGLLQVNDKTSSFLKDAGFNEKSLKLAIKELRGGNSVGDQGAENKYNSLKKYSIDLNEQAKAGKIDPVIGRDEEIRRVLQILSRRTKNNPILLGEPGVGKTAIVEGLA